MFNFSFYGHIINSVAITTAGENNTYALKIDITLTTCYINTADCEYFMLSLWLTHKLWQILWPTLTAIIILSMATVSNFMLVIIIYRLKPSCTLTCTCMHGCTLACMTHIHVYTCMYTFTIISFQASFMLGHTCTSLFI